MNTQVLILAAGKQTRWEKERKFPTGHALHKQLLRIGKHESIIERIIRQCRNRDAKPIVVTIHDAIHRSVDVECVQPGHCRWIVETLLYSPWGADRTVVLLGDVVYSKPLMDRIFDDRISVIVYGHLYEIFAVAFDSQRECIINLALKQVIAHAEKGGKGKLRMLYNSIRGADLDESSIEDQWLSYVDYMQDYTRDVDTPRDYVDLLNKVVRTGAINDEPI